MTKVSPYTTREETEIEEMARIIWIGWDDEWTDIVEEIQLAAGRLYVMGYRKTNLKLETTALSSKFDGASRDAAQDFPIGPQGESRTPAPSRLLASKNRNDQMKVQEAIDELGHWPQDAEVSELKLNSLIAKIGTI